MAIFKSKAGPDKREAVFHGGKTIATIVGTLETHDEGLIGTLTSLGYERVDRPLAEVLPLADVPPPVVVDEVFDLPPVPARAKRKLGGKP